MAGILMVGLLSGCGRTVRYEYTIEVQAYGTAELVQQPARVEVSWPGRETTVLMLSGCRSAATAQYVRRIGPPPRPGVIMCPPLWRMSVVVSKPGYPTWRVKYDRRDFVRVGDGPVRRIDQVTLFPEDWPPEDWPEDALEWYWKYREHLGPRAVGKTPPD